MSSPSFQPKLLLNGAVALVVFGSIAFAAARTSP